jgi:hypothetical protein
MTHSPHTAGRAESPTVANLLARYAEARQRLLSVAPPPPERPLGRRVVIRPQPHRPDYVPPAKRLPTVIITEETKQRVHDILVLAQAERNNEPLDPNRWLDIVHEVCAKHCITKAELMSVRRARNIVAARHEAMWRMSKETTMSLPAIGRRMGDRDHTTVLHGIRKYQAKVDGGVYVMPRYGRAAEAAAQ